MLKELISGKRRLATLTVATLATHGNPESPTVATVATVTVAGSQENHAFHAGNSHAQEAKTEIPPETGQGATISTEPRVEPPPVTANAPTVTVDADRILTAENLTRTIAGIWKFYGPTMTADDVADLERLLDDLDGGGDLAVIGIRLARQFARIELAAAKPRALVA